MKKIGANIKEISKRKERRHERERGRVGGNKKGRKERALQLEFIDFKYEKEEKNNFR